MAKSKKSGKKTTKATQSVKEDKLLVKDKKVEKKSTVKKADKTVKAKVEKVEVKSNDKKNGFWKKFFAKKYTENENILTIFKDKKAYGALLGELFGTMFITMLILTLGLYQLLYLFLIFIVIFVAVHRLSGAHLNPIATVGMMVTRRISVIRGVLYLLAQVVGAWLGLTIIDIFLKASGAEVELPGMTATPDGMFWAVSMIEFFGASIIGFFFSRAQQYRHSSLTFGAMVSGGTILALILVYIISANYFSLEGTFMLNPAVSLMYQILPQSANGVGELLGGIAIALVTYVVFPIVGGVLGFYLSDITEALVED
ncbi:aquaporin [Candidatus Saccharibacteria bacterium]|nr:aquaporin [Candidatus Saccharibacteria bacterium]